tara:strand:- start:17520 stop:17951 length:432 start_codon:yes stop_codon:yes gene_type:complete
MTLLEVSDAAGMIAVASLFGSMLFFSCVVAPLVFVELDAATAGRLIRRLFPWYYAVVGALALIGAACFAAGRPADALVMTLVLSGAVLSRQVLMPRINRHRDRMLGGDATAETPFERLHRLSVWINGAQLLAALVVLIRLALY